ncbi:microviridin/marinostatin family tricyclic proteinase inhibitor [Sinomicrobium weinanense]|uniref:Microviridin/marinostatin family tricyclic proteinase inhibitor n=1 Tax=Sinomicrobium weinanense TaxID=2842200 RepID=A0A926Q3P8_9FLAO|nr:microviridin/marinostatin family tricyclic proteinase inhibitor [Sinomicrobium weinanense]MBC9797783.1 microviridin/marinostatin family tricyclic proteinase inhibitor [Sinomicrobium weinanense]MBU3124867.1 microviridin/marinostatin family tricyclic proteinase inhibitor [Sinomicrobium weinanense]
MKKESQGLKKPFFANFLEHQVSEEKKETVQGGTTLKFPSDQEDDGGGVISATVTSPVLDQDKGGDVTQKFPSDDDEEGDIM